MRGRRRGSRTWTENDGEGEVGIQRDNKPRDEVDLRWGITWLERWTHASIAWQKTNARIPVDRCTIERAVNRADPMPIRREGIERARRRYMMPFPTTRVGTSINLRGLSRGDSATAEGIREWGRVLSWTCEKTTTFHPRHTYDLITLGCPHPYEETSGGTPRPQRDLNPTRLRCDQTKRNQAHK